MSLANIPGSDLPLGQTPGGRSCTRLAILFHWASPEDRQDKVRGPVEVTKYRNRVRTISDSLAMEIKMLSITDVFAILPCP